jgi:hypothetical protein
MREQIKVVDQYRPFFDVEVELLRSIVDGEESAAVTASSGQTFNLYGHPDDRQGGATNVKITEEHLVRMLNGQTIEYESPRIQIGAYDESVDKRLADTYVEVFQNDSGKDDFTVSEGEVIDFEWFVESLSIEEIDDLTRAIRDHMIEFLTNELNVEEDPQRRRAYRAKLEDMGAYVEKDVEYEVRKPKIDEWADFFARQ